MLEWDGDKANDYFIALHNRINIEGARYKANRSSAHSAIHDILLANRDFYGECAMNAWTKERFINFLERDRAVPNGDSLDAEKYLKSYSEELKNIKSEFESGELLKKILSS